MRNVSTIKYIVIHYTANDGDTATANGNYFKNKVITASAHYFVDDNKIIQSVPDNYVAYAVGGKKLNNKAKLYGKAKNANTLNIELCDTIKNGVIYPSEATIAQTVELTKVLMQKYNIPASNVIRHQDVTGKNCPAYWSDDTKWQNEFKARLTSDAPVITTNNTANLVNIGDSNIEIGQQHSINFTGHKIATDGKRGPDSKEQAVRVVQHALNLDYNAGLLEDGQWGNKTDKAFGKHYVAKGEKQYLVTAAEILCYLMAKNPNGVECPGSYGNGLASATGKTKLDINWFKGACS
jgi:N-acetylmuramoyl-L-alanine amidase